MKSRMYRLESIIGHLQAAMDHSRSGSDGMTDEQIDKWQVTVEDHIETARNRCVLILDKARRIQGERRMREAQLREAESNG